MYRSKAATNRFIFNSEIYVKQFRLNLIRNGEIKNEL